MTAPSKKNGILVQVLEDFKQRQAESRERACGSKKRFADEYAARAVGTKAMERNVDQEQLYFYPCQHCRGYHLTRRARPPYYAVDYLEKEAYK